MFQVTVTPTAQLPPKRFWVVSITTNQNLISTPHVITSLVDNPSAERTVDVNLNIDPTTTRHDGVTKSQRLVILQVYMSEPEADLVYSPKQDRVASVLRLRKYPVGADEVLQVYHCRRFALDRLRATKQMTIVCRKRDEQGRYARESFITVKIQNKFPEILSDAELYAAKLLEQSLEIASPTRLAMLEDAMGEPFTLSSSKRLRKFEIAMRRPISTSEDLRSAGVATLKRQAPRRGNLVKFRDIAYLPKTVAQMEITTALKNYRAEAARFAQTHFDPPRISIERLRERPTRLSIIDMLFFDMNYFNENPIICCFMDMGADSNELFWLNLLRGAQRLEKDGGMKFDPDTGWVHMFTSINAVGGTYALEPIDVYNEIWYSRTGDCDESFQIVQMFQMFLRATFRDPELLRLQKNAAKYVPCGAFWYATTASAGDNIHGTQLIARDPKTGKPLVQFSYRGGYEVSEGDPIGHMCAMFIKHEFFEQIIDGDLDLTENPDDDSCILIAEGTSLMAARLDADVPKTKHYMYADRLAQRSATSHKFYTRLMGIFTPTMLDKGLHSFICYSKSAPTLESGRHEMGVSINDLIKNPGVLGAMAYPKLKKEFVSLCVTLADARAYCPDFLCETTTDADHFSGLKPSKTFVTTEDNDQRYKTAVMILHDLFDRPAKDRPDVPKRIPGSVEPLNLVNKFQPKTFGKGEGLNNEPEVVKNVFTVDDILRSEDALRTMAKELLADYRIKKTERWDVMQEMVTVFVEFERV